MSAETAELPPQTEAKHHAAFFRQSGWLMMATIAGGLFMWGTHFLSKVVPESEYGLFGTFLSVIMVLPTIPLQMILTQQTAKALANHRERELSGVIRLMLLGALGMWLVACVVVWGLQGTILDRLHLTNSTGLWLTMGVVLVSLWLPMVSGVLQGQQNFFWLGWVAMINGILRVSVAFVAVLAFRKDAIGILVGVLCGVGLTTIVAAWQCRALWLPRPVPFDWQTLLRQITPLLLGFLGFQILFTADTPFVQSFLPEQTGYYVSAGTLSRALMWLVLPLAAVMFPRLVHSAAKSEKTDLAGLVLTGTAILAISGAVALSLMGPLVVRIVAKPSYVPVACALLPWYASAMVPAALANVLLNNLLARPSSKMPLGLTIFILALVYLFALTQLRPAPSAPVDPERLMKTILQTMGVCNLVLFGICAAFTWGPFKSKV